MKIKTKMLKKLVAVLCAATMVASGAVVSVGAAGEGENEDINNCGKKIENLDEKLEKEEKEDDYSNILRGLNDARKELEEDMEELEEDMEKLKKEEERKAALQCYAVEEVDIDEEFIIETWKKEVDQTVEKLKEALQNFYKFKTSENIVAGNEKVEEVTKAFGNSNTLANEFKNKFVCQQAKKSFASAREAFKKFFVSAKEALEKMNKFRKEFKDEKALKEIEELRAKYNEARKRPITSPLREDARNKLTKAIDNYCELVKKYGKYDDEARKTSEELLREKGKIAREEADIVGEACLGAEMEELKKAAMSPEQQKLFKLKKLNELKEFDAELDKKVKEAQHPDDIDLDDMNENIDIEKKVEQKNMRIGDNNIANGNKKVKEALHPDDIDLDDMNENIDIKEKVAQKNMRIGDNLFSLHLLRKFNRLFILKG